MGNYGAYQLAPTAPPVSTWTPGTMAPMASMAPTEPTGMGGTTELPCQRRLQEFLGGTQNYHAYSVYGANSGGPLNYGAYGAYGV